MSSSDNTTAIIVHFLFFYLISAKSALTHSPVSSKIPSLLSQSIWYKWMKLLKAEMLLMWGRFLLLLFFFSSNCGGRKWLFFDRLRKVSERIGKKINGLWVEVLCVLFFNISEAHPRISQTERGCAHRRKKKKKELLHDAVPRWERIFPPTHIFLVLFFFFFLYQFLPFHILLPYTDLL